MEEVGVEAIVQGLMSFLGDMKKVNSSLDGLRPTATGLDSVFGTLGNTLSNIGDAIINVAEYALGGLLKDAIEWAIKQIKDLISSTFDAASMFQLLRMRLQGINLQTLIESGQAYTKAMKGAVEITKQQLDWILKLAAVTPFDATDISNIYTMGRAYGLGDEAAKKLTASILDFTAAMGLNGDVAVGLIQNLGKMIERGKITTQVMTYMARSAFLPLPDILARMAKNMGITVTALQTMISSGKGVPADEFIKAFEEMTGSEERFMGGAQRMAKTFQGASDNIMQTIRDLLGFYIVMPILDVLGEKLSNLLSAFTDNADTWAKFTTVFDSIGKTLALIVAGVVGVNLSPDNIVNAILKALQDLAAWLDYHEPQILSFFWHLSDMIGGELVPFIMGKLVPAIATFVQWIWDNREGILGFFQGIGDIIVNKIVPFVQDQLIPNFKKISDWVNDHHELIVKFFDTLATIIGNVATSLLGIAPGTTAGKGLDGLLNTIQRLMQYVIDHPDTIEKFLRGIVMAMISFAVGSIMLKGSLDIVTGAIGMVVKIFTTFLGLIVVFPIWLATHATSINKTCDQLNAIILYFLTQMFANFLTILTQLDGIISYYWNLYSDRVKTILLQLVGIIWWLWTTAFNVIVGVLIDIGNSISSHFRQFIVDIQTILGISKEKSSVFIAIGEAMMNGIIGGIDNILPALIQKLKDAIANAYQALLDWLGIHSPSLKFKFIGEMSMLGLAEGFTDYANIATDALLGAISRVTAPTMILPSTMATSSVSNSYHNSFQANLHIHSSANSEPILADFAMLQSLMGGS